MLTLYDFALSGSCHKVRMLLAELGLQYDLVDVDLLKSDQTSDAFVQINPLNKVPVLADDGFVLRDSTAIMVYLARKYGADDWWSEVPEELGEIQQWLSFSVNEIFHGVATARAIVLFDRDQDLGGPQALARKSLGVLETRLNGADWLVAGRLTLADLACYPYVALAYQGDVSLSRYPAVCDWVRRIEARPGYVGMPGLPRPG